MDDLAIYGEAALERLQELPGGPELLATARRHGGVELVGGAVRDLLLGRSPRELDVLVVGDVDPIADDLAERLGGTVVRHERFGTAVVEAPAARIDLAQARAESYSAPGALPDVRPGTLEQDLQRRDFTVNAIAVALDRGEHPRGDWGGDAADPAQGGHRAVGHALEDLAAGRLRVLHDDSFLDDPTRLLRLARYRARLGFAVEERTAQLAREALAARALDTVSGARVGAELRLALGEPDALASLAALSELGILAALHPRLRFEEPSARDALALLPGDGRPDLLLLAASTLPLALRAGGDDPRAEISALLDRLEFPAGDRDRVARAAAAVARLTDELPAAPASALRRATHGVPLEGIALAGAVGGADARRQARRWLDDARHVRLTITGDDLLAAGIPAGPDVGRRLDATLDRRLDGELPDGRDAELAAALEASR